MPTATVKRAPARRAATPKPKVEFPSFEFGDVTSYPAIMAELERYVEYASVRKGMATSTDKAQYWSGQLYASKSFIAALRAQIDWGGEGTEEVA